MEKTPAYESHRKLGKKAKIGDGSVRYMLTPQEGNPTIDNIAKVAEVFGLEPWQILHPDMPVRAMSQKETAMYEAIAKAYEDLPKPPANNHPKGRRP